MHLNTGVVKATFCTHTQHGDSWKSGALNQTKTVPLKQKLTFSSQDFGPLFWQQQQQKKKKKWGQKNVENRPHRVTIWYWLQGTSQQGFKVPLQTDSLSTKAWYLHHKLLSEASVLDYNLINTG